MVSQDANHVPKITLSITAVGVCPSQVWLGVMARKPASSSKMARSAGRVFGVQCRAEPVPGALGGRARYGF